MAGGGQPGHFSDYASQAAGAVGNIGGMIGGKYGGYIQEGAKYAQQGLNMYNQAKPWLKPISQAASSGWNMMKNWWNRGK